MRRRDSRKPRNVPWHWPFRELSLVPQPISHEVSTMAKQREVVNYEFVKFTTIGKSVAGRVKSFGKNDQGTFIVFEPVFVRPTRNGKWSKYGGAAVGLTTDLRRKIFDSDVSKVFRITFNDTKPSQNPDPQKLFLVEELERDEIIQLAADATPVEGPVNTDGGQPGADYDDDLPF